MRTWWQRTSLFAIRQCRRRDRKVSLSWENVGDIHIFARTHVSILICPGPPVANPHPFAHRIAFMNPAQLYADERKRTHSILSTSILISRRYTYEEWVEVQESSRYMNVYYKSVFIPRMLHIITTRSTVSDPNTFVRHKLMKIFSMFTANSE